MIKRAIAYTEVTSREKQERLSRIANSEFILIGAATGERYWFDDVEKVYYREYTCNGPSSWSESK